MLPIDRLIGHRDYGNRPPGGYPGRKSDPRYSMDWRRARVANFTPRTGDDEPMTEAEMDRLAEKVAQKVWEKRLPQPDDKPGAEPAQAATILAHTRAATKTISAQVSEVEALLPVTE